MYGREFRRQFYGVKGQTDMADYVSLRDQRRMHITFPPLPEQRAANRFRELQADYAQDGLVNQLLPD